MLGDPLGHGFGGGLLGDSRVGVGGCPGRGTWVATRLADELKMGWEEGCLVRNLEIGLENAC